MTDTETLSAIREIVEEWASSASNSDSSFLWRIQAILQATAAIQPSDLPPLPTPHAHIGKFLDDCTDVFTGEQMRAYALCATPPAASQPGEKT